MRNIILTIAVLVLLSLAGFLIYQHTQYAPLPAGPTPTVSGPAASTTREVAQEPTSTAKPATTTKPVVKVPPAEQVVVSSPDPWVEDLIALVNTARMVTLKESGTLDQIAASRALYVCQQDFVESVHTGFATYFGSTTFQYIAENLARNYDAAEDTEAGFMASPSHHANIVDPRYSYIGVAHVTCPTNNWGNKDITVQLFGGYAK